MLLGYNTNGFANHRLSDALEIIAELGYRSVAITLDIHALDPSASRLETELAGIRRLLVSHRLSCVIETGARFLLDPRRKHEPTLVSAAGSERRRRLDFLKRAVDIGAALGAAAVSCWSGKKAPALDEAQARDVLAESCRELAGYAEQNGLVIAFEPEPGMLIENLTDYGRLARLVEHPAFRLTLDVGHALITEPDTPGACIRKHAREIANIHLEDMRRNSHEHLFFGEGEIDFNELFAALHGTDYRGPLHIELSRHSHDAVATARRAFGFVSRFL